MRFIVIAFTFFSGILSAQLSFSGKEIDLGNIPEAYEIKGDLVIKNEGARNVFLLRADADKGVKVFASKKTITPGDTALLVISFIPESGGKFSKKIKLISSDSEKPHELKLSGDLDKLKKDDKMACYYFGSRRNTNVKIKDEPIAVHEKPDAEKDKSNKIPDHPSEPVVTFTPQKNPEPVKKPLDESELSRDLYKPNNLLFLVDVSNSMKDSMKLPLMKQALLTLIDAVRDIDSLTFVTYSDSVKVIRESLSGKEKAELKKIVGSIKARGMTKGRQAILKSQALAQTHFIKGGNNLIMLVTDGEFFFSTADQEKWKERQGDKKIVISTIAFGDDKKAMRNLKSIAEIGDGSFIHIREKEGSEKKLLEEIRMRSRKGF